MIDHSFLRHHKSTVNSKWGEDVAIVLGDYLYSVGFGLISSCQNTDVLSCISQATRVMCEGELIQVCERDNIDLLKKSYITIVKNKTARLFAASCQAGAIIANCRKPVQMAFKEYGLNFGIAFQIVDDSLDLIARPEELGKSPGADFKVGELTLPVLNLLSQYEDKRGIISLIRQKHRTDAFREIRKKFINSRAYLKTKEDVWFYVRKAKRSLDGLEDSLFKQSLFELTDYVAGRMRA